MVVYDVLSNYDSYKRIFNRYENVIVSKTRYSIKIDFGKKKVFLNKDGNSNGNVFQLINKIKKDCNNYLSGNKINTTKSKDIFWYYYNELSGATDKVTNIAKIDLKSAYWTKGINIGMISKETNDYFNSLKFDSVKDKKAARLKALGSLATVKSIEKYIRGVRQKDFNDPVYDEQQRDMYMYICNEVAKDMQTVLYDVNGIYYYWDCIFIDVNSISRVTEIFKILGYDFSIEIDNAEVILSKYFSYLICEKTGIRYPIN